MLKQIIYIILFITGGMIYSLSGQDLFLTNGDVSSYPENYIEFYSYNENNVLVNDIKKDNLIFKYNDEVIEDYELEVPENSEVDSVSIIFSIDISNSNAENMELIRSSILNFLDYLPDGTFEIALLTFNLNSYVNQNLTEDKSNIERALNNINTFSAANFNAAFLSSGSNIGSLEIAQNSKYKPVIITITNGFADASTQDIIRETHSNTSINSICIKDRIPENLKRISEESSGVTYSNIDSESSILKAYLNILNTNKGIEPNIIRFDSEDCAIDKIFNLELIDQELSDELTVNISKDELPYLEIDPQYYDFGTEQGTTEFTFTARNSDILIENYIPENSEFEILTDLDNKLLKKNEPVTVEVKNQNPDNKYIFEKFTFISNACTNSELRISSGEINNKTNTNIFLSYPNGGEIFYPGQEIEIKWDSVTPNQSVMLEYTSNSGEKWNTITNNATGLKHIWSVPSSFSTEYKVKASLPTDRSRLKNVKYLRHSDNDKKIEMTAISPDESLSCLSYRDGTLLIWDNENESIHSTLSEGLSYEYYDIKWSPNSNYVAVSFKTTDNNIIIWDTTGSPPIIISGFDNARANQLHWNSEGSKIYAGFDNGKVLKWDLSAKDSPIEVLDFGNSIEVLDINPEKKIISIGGDLKVAHYDSTNNIILNEFEFNEEVTDIQWSPDSKKVAVSTEFRDVFLFNLTDSDGDLSIKSAGNIHRDEKPSTIDQVRWTDSENILLSSKEQTELEYWNVVNKKINFEFEHINKPFSSIDNSDKTIISASDTNFAMIWNIDDYPFDLKSVAEDESDDHFTVIDKNLEIKNVDLGLICLNNSYDNVIKKAVTNPTEPLIEIDSISVHPDVKEIFTIKNSFPIELKQGESFDLRFNYTPRNVGKFKHILELHYDTRVDTITVDVKHLSTSYSNLKSSINFGNTAVNSIGFQEIELFSNNNSEELVMEDIEIIHDKEIFNIESVNIKDTIMQGEKLRIKFSFSPGEPIKYTGLLRVKLKDVCSPIYISLLGKGVKINLLHENFVDFGAIVCEDDFKDTTISIQNLTSANVEILNAEIENSSTFEIIDRSDTLPKSLIPGDKLSVNVRYKPEDEGDFENELIFETNLTGIDKFKNIPLHGTKGNFQLEFSEDTLNLGVVGKNEDATGKITVKNNSNVEYQWNFPVTYENFKFLSASPSTTAPGGSSELTFNYLGSEKDTNISINFPLIDSCDYSKDLPMEISISNGIAQIQVDDNIDLGSVVCDTTLSFNINISNTGDKNLVIENTIFEGKNSNLFSIMNVVNEESIEPGNNIQIQVDYTPEESGDIYAELVLTSNAANAENSKTVIVIELIQMNPELTITDNSVHFTGLRDNREYSDEVEISNSGNVELFLEYDNDTHFEVDSIVPNPILPGETATVYVKFIGGEPTTTYTGNINLFDQCGNENSISLAADVGSPRYVSIFPGDVEIETGKEFTLPIKFINNSAIELDKLGDQDTIFTELSFNSTLMVPLEDKYKGEIDEEGNRIIELAFPLNANLQNEDDIYNIKMISTLGDTSYSEIRLTQSTHKNNEFFINDEEFGSIKLLNIVKEPNDRFIDGTGLAYLEQNKPNPADNTTTINFGIIENTNVSMEIYNIYGNKIKTVFSEFLDPGEYSEEIDISNFASGNYLYILKTPSMRFIKKMTIIR